MYNKLIEQFLAENKEEIINGTLDSYYEIARRIISENKLDLTYDYLSRKVSKIVKKRFKDFGHYGKKQGVPEHIGRFPNIFVFDVETLPMEVFVFGLYKQRISHKAVKNDWCMLSWVGKWLFQDEVYSDCLTPEEARSRNDKRIATSIWQHIEQADVVIAHNGNRFDVKVLNARFFLNGLMRPSPYQVIDTLKITQNTFKFSSHKLDYISQIVFDKKKLETELDLWIRCTLGEQDALDYMLEYNIKDTLLLEEAYIMLRPWMKSHPNMAIYSDATESCCPVCMSNDYAESGQYVTPAGSYTSYRCNKCKAPFRARTSNLTIEERKKLLISTAR